MINTSLLDGVFLSKKSKETILKYQSKIVSEIVVGVVPVDTVIQYLLNISTKGELEEKLNLLEISDLLHPFIIFIFKDKSIGDHGQLRYERVNRVVLHENISKKATERYFKPNLKVNITLGELIENHIKYLGGSYDKILMYRPDTQNSQIFVQSFLKSNHMNSIQLEDFYLQPTEQIMKSFNSTNELVSKITLLGLTFDYILGNGIKKNK